MSPLNSERSSGTLPPDLVLEVLGFGTYDVQRHPRIGVVLEGLRERGHKVFEVNVPMGIETAHRVQMIQRSRTAYRLVFRLARCWTQLIQGSRQLQRRAGRPEVVIVGYLGHFDVLLARLLYGRAVIILDLLVFAADTARDRGVSQVWKIKILNFLDGLAIRTATIVLLDADEQVELISDRMKHKAIVVPVGAPRNWHLGHEPTVRRDFLKVIFYGLYTPLQGANIIGEAIVKLRDRHDIQFTLIGDGQDFETTRAIVGNNANVSWVPWVEPEKLPSLVASHDVCLGIFGVTPKAKRVTPNKVFQGAAAGCAIITSDTSPQRRSLADAALFVKPGDAVGLAAAIAALADDRTELDRLRTAARWRARSEFVPASIVAPLVRGLASAP